MLSVLKCERIKDVLCTDAPDRVLRCLFAQAEKQTGSPGALSVTLCVDMLAYVELFHLCEMIGDAMQDILERVPEDQRQLRKADRMNALALMAANRVRRR